MRLLAALADWRHGIRFDLASKGNERQISERKYDRDDEDCQHELDHAFADFFLGVAHGDATSLELECSALCAVLASEANQGPPYRRT